MTSPLLPTVRANRRRRLALSGAVGLALLGAAGGCVNLSYRGAAPSVRTFADEPTTRDYYIGMDIRFAVLEPADERRLEAARTRTVAAGQPAETVDDAALDPEVEESDNPADLPGTTGPTVVAD